MKDLVESFPNQLNEAVRIGERAKLTSHKKKISNVLISGLGGSGIGGTIVGELVALEATVPIAVSKGYFIPKFVNENSLVVISSYSGNTEETLHCLNLAIKRKAKIVCVTSGGKVAETAKKKNLDIILVPGGMPPRSCLGYLLTQLFFILGFHKIISAGFKSKLKASAELLVAEKEKIRSEARSLAEKLYGKTPLIYATTYYEGVAIRFRQQLNENAKMLCSHHAIPEMNHNELVGWASGSDKIAVVIFRDTDEFAQNNKRIEINKEIIRKFTPNISEIFSKGRSNIEKAIYFIHLGDWASVFLAEMKNVDSMEVRVIDFLKSELAK
jgi:glucose/mannose-6-phosphate isomerase